MPHILRGLSHICVKSLSLSFFCCLFAFCCLRARNFFSFFLSFRLFSRFACNDFLLLSDFCYNYVRIWRVTAVMSARLKDFVNMFQRRVDVIKPTETNPVFYFFNHEIFLILNKESILFFSSFLSFTKIRPSSIFFLLQTFFFLN